MFWHSRATILLISCIQYIKRWAEFDLKRSFCARFEYKAIEKSIINKVRAREKSINGMKKGTFTRVLASNSINTCLEGEEKGVDLTFATSVIVYW